MDLHLVKIPKMHANLLTLYYVVALFQIFFYQIFFSYCFLVYLYSKTYFLTYFFHIPIFWYISSSHLELSFVNL